MSHIKGHLGNSSVSKRTCCLFHWREWHCGTAPSKRQTFVLSSILTLSATVSHLLPRTHSKTINLWGKTPPLPTYCTWGDKDSQWTKTNRQIGTCVWCHSSYLTYTQTHKYTHKLRPRQARRHATDAQILLPTKAGSASWSSNQNKDKEGTPTPECTGGHKVWGTPLLLPTCAHAHTHTDDTIAALLPVRQLRKHSAGAE